MVNGINFKFMTVLLFNFCNTCILLVWGSIIIFPNSKISNRLITYPWVPLVISFFYTYFIFISGGISDADFSSLEGIVTLFRNASPESAAAGWLHYLAFDFWVGSWIIRHSKKHKIKHYLVILPLLATFMLGPVGILLYSIIYFGVKYFTPAN